MFSVRSFRFVVLAVIGAALFVFALANRGSVKVQILPQEASGLLPFENAYVLPLFVVMFAGILLGLLLGFVWEWIREHRQRADAAQQKREARTLKRENEKLRAERGDDKDDVLTLLEQK
jgi:putative membrane protein